MMKDLFWLPCLKADSEDKVVKQKRKKRSVTLSRQSHLLSFFISISKTKMLKTRFYKCVWDVLTQRKKSMWTHVSLSCNVSPLMDPGDFLKIDLKCFYY